jgi:hypothetical protein
METAVHGAPRATILAPARSHLPSASTVADLTVADFYGPGHAPEVRSEPEAEVGLERRHRQRAGGRCKRRCRRQARAGNASLEKDRERNIYPQTFGEGPRPNMDCMLRGHSDRLPSLAAGHHLSLLFLSHSPY